MKMHLLLSESPIKEHQDEVAACGKQIKKAKFVMELAMDGERKITLASTMFCRGCNEHLVANVISLKTMYLYGIIDGESSKQPDVD
jgi:hypothetical protein